MYPDHRMSSLLSVLAAQGSVRPSPDCTAQGQHGELSRGCLDQVDTGYERGQQMELNRKAPATLSVAWRRVGTLLSTGSDSGSCRQRPGGVRRKPTEEQPELSLGGLERRGVPDNVSETGPAPSSL